MTKGYKIVAIIPARYASSRFEGKPLALIGDHPMIEWVARRVAKSSMIDKVIVAVDDHRIASACEAAGLLYIMTGDHDTSTERVEEVASKVFADLYIVVNGDEPLIDADMVEKVIPQKWPTKTPFIANLACKVSSPAEAIDPTNIKVIWGADKRALYFSRSPIPFPKGSLDLQYYKHIGIIAYNAVALRFFANTPKGPLEKAEDVNELRFLENGVPLEMIIVAQSSSLSVDTPKDLDRVRCVVREEGISIDD